MKTLNDIKQLGMCELSTSEMEDIYGGRSFWENIGYNVNVLWNRTKELARNIADSCEKAWNTDYGEDYHKGVFDAINMD